MGMNETGMNEMIDAVKEFEKCLSMMNDFELLFIQSSILQEQAKRLK